MKEMPTGIRKPLEGYSEAFVKDVERVGLEKLLKSSDFGGTFEDWEAQRRFLSPAFRDGSLLDYGCASGLFLRCMQEWSKKKLDPYGVDTQVARIQIARELFPDVMDHFQDVEKARQAMNEGSFPTTFDSIYWNVWDDVDFQGEKGQAFLRRGLELIKPGGRFVLGFYDVAGRPRIDEKVSQLLSLGYKPSEQLLSESGQQSGIILEK